MKTQPHPFSTRLRRWRGRRSRRAAAGLLGISHRTVEAYELQRRCPAGLTLEAILARMKN